MQAVTEAAAIAMAETLHCSVFDVWDLDVDDYLHWMRAADEHNRRRQEEMDKCRT